MLVASMPCLLGFNALSGVQLAGKGILDMEDFMVSNLLLPIGALIYVVFCSTKFGWGFENFRAEVNTGKGIRLAGGFKYYFRFALPVLILVVLISGLVR